MTASRRRALELLVLFVGVAPALVAWCFKLAVRPRPFWAFYYDPELIYLGDGLRLLRGQIPIQAHNPGAPITLLSAPLAALAGGSILDVERFRLFAYLLAIGLFVAGAWLLLRTVLAESTPAVQVVGLWVYLLAPKSLEYLTIWSPEILFFPAGALALAALKNASDDDWTTKACFWLGASLGLLCSLKLTFVGWAAAGGVILLTAVPGALRMRRASAFAGGAVGCFLLLTVAQWPRFGVLLEFAWNMMARGGEYGEGAHGLPPLADSLTGYVSFLASARPWHLGLVLLGCAAAAALLRGKAGTSARCLTGFAAVAIPATYLLAVRRPDGHYLLPAGLAAVALLPGASGFSAAGRRRSLGTVAMVSVAGALVARAVWLDLGVHERRVEHAETLQQELRSAAAKHGPPGREPVVLFSFRAPIPSTALHLLGHDPRDHAEVFARYPDEGYFDWWNRTVIPPKRDGWDVAFVDPRAVPAEAVPSSTRVGSVGEFLVLIPARGSLP